MLLAKEAAARALAEDSLTSAKTAAQVAEDVLNLAKTEAENLKADLKKSMAERDKLTTKLKDSEDLIAQYEEAHIKDTEMRIELEKLREKVKNSGLIDRASVIERLKEREAFSRADVIQADKRLAQFLATNGCYYWESVIDGCILMGVDIDFMITCTVNVVKRQNMSAAEFSAQLKGTSALPPDIVDYIINRVTTELKIKK